MSLCRNCRRKRRKRTYEEFSEVQFFDFHPMVYFSRFLNEELPSIDLPNIQDIQSRGEKVFDRYQNGRLIEGALADGSPYELDIKVNQLQVRVFKGNFTWSYDGQIRIPDYGVRHGLGKSRTYSSSDYVAASLAGDIEGEILSIIDKEDLSDLWTRRR